MMAIDIDTMAGNMEVIHHTVPAGMVNSMEGDSTPLDMATTMDVSIGFLGALSEYLILQNLLS